MTVSLLASEIDSKRGIGFLVELANSPLAEWPYPEEKDEIAALARLRRRFEEFCPSDYPLLIAHDVRKAWEQPTLRMREAFLFATLTAALYRCDPPNPKHKEVEKWNRIAAALWTMGKASHRMRLCANPECPAPCFVAEKKNQRYCGEKCAGSGQRELKRLWWAEHGPAWRKARKRAEAKKKGKGRKS